MSESRKWAASSSRRNFVKAAAGITAGTMLTRQPMWAQSSRSKTAAAAGPLRLFPRSIHSS